MKNLFFLSCHKIGLSSLLVEQAINLEKYTGIDNYFFSGENEQEKGLRTNLIENNIKLNIINGLDEHKNFLRLVKLFSNYSQEIKPDFVHVQTNWQLIIVICSKILNFQKFKILYTIHGFRNNNKFKSKIALILIQLLLKLFVRRIYSASSFVTNKFTFVNDKIKTIFLGVENNFFKYNKSINNNKDFDELIIFYPAAFRQGKNQIEIIKVVESYLKTVDKNIKLYLAGEGIEKKICTNYTLKNDLKNNVYFLGQISRDEILYYFEQSNISVINSDSETFGHCIAEPFVLGSCVVTKNIGVAQDIIQNNKNGFLFRDNIELFEVLKMLNQNNDLIKKVSLNAFKNRKIFKWSKLVIDYENDLVMIEKGC